MGYLGAVDWIRTAEEDELHSIAGLTATDNQRVKGRRGLVAGASNRD